MLSKIPLITTLVFTCLAATATAQADDAKPTSIAGFTALEKNAQGMAEYRHDLSGMVFVLIPGGTFEMGSPADEEGRFRWEGPVHTVTITPFLLAKYELTQPAWTTVMKSTPWRGRNYSRTGPKFPATSITWTDCKNFCAKSGLRFPSEAEWEYACRAGSTTRFHFGDDETKLDQYAWFEDNSWSIGERFIHEVKLKKPNAYGLYDMHGNVWEWCADTWHAGYDGAPADGRPWIDDKSAMRIQRGGSWLYDPWNCRSASRLRNVVTFQNDHLGFRPAFSLPERD